MIGGEVFHYLTLHEHAVVNNMDVNAPKSTVFYQH